MKNETISYSRTLSNKHIDIVKKPSFSDQSMFNFDEIYTLTFSLDPIVQHTKDIWMVQDPEEPAGRRLAESNS